MKRSKEVTIILNALVDAGLITQGKTDRARCVIEDAIKEIRCEQYKERHKTDLFATEKEG